MIGTAQSNVHYKDWKAEISMTPAGGRFDFSIVTAANFSATFELPPHQDRGAVYFAESGSCVFSRQASEAAKRQ
jgi:hypothetical protein